MSEGIRSHIEELRGNMHSGSGDLNIFLGTERRPVAPGRSPLIIPEAYLRALDQYFVAPAHLGLARELLRSRRMVLLTGSPGSGRSTAASILLHEVGADGTGECRELPDRTSEEGPVSSLDPEDVGSGDRLLLDLSESDTARLASVQKELPSFHATVLTRQAYLVVLLSPGALHLVSGGLPGFATEIGRPDPVAVLRAHLRAHSIVADQDALKLPELQEHLRDAPMWEIAQLADFARHERDAKRGAGHFSEWLQEAFARQTQRSDQVASALVNVLKTGPQRALLFAAAVFEGCRSDVVHHATARLLTIVDQAPEDGTLLEHRDLAQRLGEIKAARDAGGRVRFASMGYAEAVRRHFWDCLPDLRPRLAKWTGAVLSLPILEPSDRNNLIRRFAELCLPTEEPAFVLALIEEWTAIGSSRAHQAAATQTLGLALLHRRHNRQVLERVYDWSRQQGLRRELARPLITVCAGVMAQHQPDRALVRLHHLARWEPATAPRSARDALLELVGSDNRLRRRMLNRLGPGLPDAPRDIDIELFLDVADPDRLTCTESRTRPLIAEAAVREDLTAGWRAVLRLPHQRWNAHARDWLEAARQRDRYREPLLRVLVDACEGHGSLLSRLYATAHGWGGTTETFARLRELIDTAQDIQPLRTGT